MKFRLETMNSRKHTTQNLMKLIELVFIKEIQQLKFQQPGNRR